MNGLRSKAHTLKTVNRYVPTSQLCLELLPDGSRCMELNKFELDEREYICGKCGSKKDRDTHSAQDTLLIGTGRVSIEEINKVLMGHKHYKIPMEEVTSAKFCKSLLMKSEAHEFIRG